MKKTWQVRFGLAALFSLPLLGCGADTFQSAPVSSQQQQSANQKGKNKMPTQSPMLNEILASAKGIAPGTSNDVSHIVSKYIPIGTSKEQTKKILEQMNHRYTEKERFLRTGYRGDFFPFVPTPGISIEFHFNQSDYLESIDAQFSYAQ